jgi:hypothetical protein
MKTPLGMMGMMGSKIKGKTGTKMSPDERKAKIEKIKGMMGKAKAKPANPMGKMMPFMVDGKLDRAKLKEFVDSRRQANKAKPKPKMGMLGKMTGMGLGGQIMSKIKAARASKTSK